jgi:hypothetical protein
VAARARILERLVDFRERSLRIAMAVLVVIDFWRS